MAWVVVNILCAGRWNVKARVAVALLVFGAALLPFNGLLLAQYLRGFVGDLSITTLGLLVFGAFCFLWGYHPVENYHQQKPIFLFLAVAGVLLYPMSAGLTMFDPYALGYAPRYFGIILLVFALYCGWKNYYLALILLSCVVFFYAIGFLPSHNLWDYLIDPLVFLYAIGWLIVHGILAFFKSFISCKISKKQS